MKDDKIFKDILANDSPELESNEDIRRRLNYAFQLKSSSYKVKTNSFMGMFAWFFSFKSLGIKTGIVTMLLLSSVFVNRIDSNRTLGIQADSIRMDTEMCDTLKTFSNKKDSIRIN